MIWDKRHNVFMMLICFLQRKLYFNITTTDLFPKPLLWLSWLSVFKVMLNIVQC